MNKMTTFPRLAALSKDPDGIMDAIESFGQGQLMQVDRDLCRIRRNPGYIGIFEVLVLLVNMLILSF